MSHDLIAELEGYRSELAGYERSGVADRAKAVKAEIARITKQVSVEADKLIAQAEGHEDAGRDVLAAQARVEAKRLRRAVGVESAPGAENAAESAPRETAVTPKKKGA